MLPLPPVAAPPAPPPPPVATTSKLVTPAGTVNVVAPGVVKLTVTALAAEATKAKGSSTQRHMR
ncbi:MAG: hypothetical protein RIS44_2948 [Pseudomonadota bacterium]|jgi:hypothetical protein